MKKKEVLLKGQCLFILCLLGTSPIKLSANILYFVEHGRESVALKLEGQVRDGDLTLSRCHNEVCTPIVRYDTRNSYYDDAKNNINMGISSLTVAALSAVSASSSHDYKKYTQDNLWRTNFPSRFRYGLKEDRDCIWSNWGPIHVSYDLFFLEGHSFRKQKQFF